MYTPDGLRLDAGANHEIHEDHEQTRRRMALGYERAACAIFAVFVLFVVKKNPRGVYPSTVPLSRYDAPISR